MNQPLTLPLFTIQQQRTKSLKHSGIKYNVHNCRASVVLTLSNRDRPLSQEIWIYKQVKTSEKLKISPLIYFDNGTINLCHVAFLVVCENAVFTWRPMKINKWRLREDVIILSKIAFTVCQSEMQVWTLLSGINQFMLFVLPRPPAFVRTSVYFVQTSVLLVRSFALSDQ